MSWYESQEDALQTHCTSCQISRQASISQTFVVHIVHNDLQQKCLKKRQVQELTMANHLAHLSRSKQLLRNFSLAVNFIFFTNDKKITVASPINLQNDRLYVPLAVKKHDINPNRLL